MILVLFFIVGTAGFSAWFMKLTFGTPFIPALGLVASGLIAAIMSALVLLYVLSWLQYWLEKARQSEKPQNNQ